MLCFNNSSRFFVSLILLVFLTGCTAQPLYLEGRDTKFAAAIEKKNFTKAESTAIADKLDAIDIDEAKDRQTQILRNQLSYFIAQPRTGSTAKLYRLSLNATTQTIATVQTDVGDRTDRAGRPSAGTVRAHVDYILRDLQGNIIAKGQRSMSAPFDRPRQEYANLRAEENAKKLALEELALHVFFALSNDFSKM